MKKYMVRCDMEGVSGVVRQDQVVPGRKEYEYGRRMFMADLLALLRGLISGGAEEVLVYDKHFNGCNVDLSQLPDEVSVVCGNPPYRPDWAGGLDDSFEGVVLLGFAAKFGTEPAILSHSYDSDIRDMRLNGVSMGAIGMEAAIAGDYDVPVVMVTSDSSGVGEAGELFPETYCVIVKDALGNEGGICYPLSLTTSLIRGAADQVVKDPPEVEPYRVEDPVSLETELKEGAYLNTFKELFEDSMKDEHTLAIEGETVLAVWSEYQDMKRRARRAERGAEREE